MSDPAERDLRANVRSLFIRYGIPPEPEAVSALRLEATEARCAILEARADALEASFTGGNRFDAAFWSRAVNESDGGFARQINAAMIATESFADWLPSPEDWVRLSVSLAMQHEADFKFIAPQPNVGDERTWVRDMAMDQILTRQPRPSLEAASKLAVKALDAEIKEELHPNYMKTGSAGHIKTGYSKRQAARKQREAETSTTQPTALPPSLRGRLDAREHLRALLNACLRMTMWPKLADHSGGPRADIKSDPGENPWLYIGKRR